MYHIPITTQISTHCNEKYIPFAGDLLLHHICPCHYICPFHLICPSNLVHPCLPCCASYAPIPLQHVHFIRTNWLLEWLLKWVIILWHILKSIIFGYCNNFQHDFKIDLKPDYDIYEPITLHIIRYLLISHVSNGYEAAFLFINRIWMSPRPSSSVVIQNSSVNRMAIGSYMILDRTHRMTSSTCQSLHISIHRQGTSFAFSTCWVPGGFIIISTKHQPMPYCLPDTGNIFKPICVVEVLSNCVITEIIVVYIVWQFTVTLKGNVYKSQQTL